MIQVTAGYRYLSSCWTLGNYGKPKDAFFTKVPCKQEAHTSEDLPLEMFEVALGHNVMGRMCHT